MENLIQATITKKQPLVSIVIPVYNGSNYLSEAIDSALAQTYKNIEIIVVNDGSKDDGATEKIALSYGDKIRCFSKENGGVSSALNFGIEKMQGEYFSWLSHDDKYTPEKIEKQIEALNERKEEKMLLLCGTNFIDKDSKPLSRKTRQIENGYYTNVQMFSKLFDGYSIGGCALLIPRRMFEEIGLFNVELRYMQDMEMWYRALLAEYGIYYKNDDGVLTRIHGEQTTVTGSEWGKLDAKKVGVFMSNNLEGLYDGKVNLLKKYMYIAYKRGAMDTGDCAYSILKKRKEIGVAGYLKAQALKTYGKIRPFLFKCYYRFMLRKK